MPNSPAQPAPGPAPSNATMRPRCRLRYFLIATLGAFFVAPTLLALHKIGRITSYNWDWMLFNLVLSLVMPLLLGLVSALAEAVLHLVFLRAVAAVPFFYGALYAITLCKTLALAAAFYLLLIIFGIPLLSSPLFILTAALSVMLILQLFLIVWGLHCLKPGSTRLFLLGALPGSILYSLFAAMVMFPPL